MTMLRYISHPNVALDPDVPVPRWSLNSHGRRRAVMMLRQPWVGAIGRVVSSEETKARETAQILADHLGLRVEVRPELGEIDRSSTGFVPEKRHHELAAQLFAAPDQSADGWERAVDATDRMIGAARDLLANPSPHASESRSGDVAMVGHGGVGTLLYCHLADLAIEQRHDQPGQGHYWTYDRQHERIVHGWRAIEDLV